MASVLCNSVSSGGESGPSGWYEMTTTLAIQLHVRLTSRWVSVLPFSTSQVSILFFYPVYLCFGAWNMLHWPTWKWFDKNLRWPSLTTDLWPTICRSCDSQIMHYLIYSSTLKLCSGWYNDLLFLMSISLKSLLIRCCPDCVQTLKSSYRSTFHHVLIVVPIHYFSVFSSLPRRNQ
jgi:hypothetical protein